MTVNKDKNDQEQEIINNSFYASSIEASFQPLDIAFHPSLNNLIASSLVDGSLEGTVYVCFMCVFSRLKLDLSCLACTVAMTKER